jgi:hypothetical protein
MALSIYEMNYSASPNGVDTFEVHEEGETLESFDTLADAVKYCYDKGDCFTVFTYEWWEKAYGDGNKEKK